MQWGTAIALGSVTAAISSSSSPCGIASAYPRRPTAVTSPPRLNRAGPESEERDGTGAGFRVRFQSANPSSQPAGRARGLSVSEFRLSMQMYDNCEGLRVPRRTRVECGQERPSEKETPGPEGLRAEARKCREPEGFSGSGRLETEGQTASREYAARRAPGRALDENVPPIRHYRAVKEDALRAIFVRKYPLDYSR